MRQIAIIGLGFVADLYMATLTTFPDIRLSAVCDRDPKRRAKFPAYWGARPESSFKPGETVVTEDVAALIAAIAPGTVVLNLTNPHEHYWVSRALLDAGMHVYSEKPLATDMDHARELHALAAEKGLLLASAPCSVLGEAAQLMWAAVRENVAGTPRLIYAELDDGFIPQAPTEAWLSESGAPWPREDEFRVGCTLEHAGYYLTWLIAMFGPIRTVVAASADLIPGKLAPGDAPAPDFSVGTLFFESGVVARLTCSIIAKHDHRLRIICDGGSLEMPAAWTNSAPVRFRRRFRVRRRLVEHPFPKRLKPAGPTHPKVPLRGAAAMNFALGPVEMLDALAEGRPCRLSADFALHLNEVTLALQNAGETAGAVRMTTGCAPMEPMPWAVLA
ncbi:MAG: putative dehydrogenase, partial [Paracoccaceae bacterium]